MKISVLCTDRSHPIFYEIEKWAKKGLDLGHAVDIVHDKSLLIGGDFLFLLSCSQRIDKEIRGKYRFNLLLHASDLPEGRGWSPHIWAIVKGKNKITVSLLEVNDPIDSGDIWLKTELMLMGHELLPEINQKLFAVEFSLMNQAILGYENICPLPQEIFMQDTLPKRTSEDSKLDPEKSIAEQFNLLRVVDNSRYPAFFDLNGFRYVIKIQKLEAKK
jgi:methionyl-tRNA formyltransferase